MTRVAKQCGTSGKVGSQAERRRVGVTDTDITKSLPLTKWYIDQEIAKGKGQTKGRGLFEMVRGPAEVSSITQSGSMRSAGKVVARNCGAMGREFRNEDYEVKWNHELAHICMLQISF
jgi:hypothetical protein